MKAKKFRKNHCRQFKLTAIGVLLTTAIGVLLTTAAFAQTPNLLVCANKGYTLSPSEPATGSGLTYTWYESDGGDYIKQDDQANASLSVPAKNVAGTYSYVRMVAGEDCENEVASNTYTVVVLKPDVPTITVTTAAVCQDAGNLLFTIPFADNTTYTWTKTAGTDGTPASDENGSSYTVSGATPGTTTVTASASVTFAISGFDDKVCVSGVTTEANAVVNYLPVISNITAADACGGGAKTLSVQGKVNGQEEAGMTFAWYNDEEGDDQIDEQTSSTYTPSLKKTTTYYVGAIVNATGCSTAALTEVVAKVMYEGRITGAEDND